MTPHVARRSTTVAGRAAVAASLLGGAVSGEVTRLSAVVARAGVRAGVARVVVGAVSAHVALLTALVACSVPGLAGLGAVCWTIREIVMLTQADDRQLRKHEPADR